MNVRFSLMKKRVESNLFLKQVMPKVDFNPTIGAKRGSECTYAAPMWLVSVVLRAIKKYGWKPYKFRHHPRSIYGSINVDRRRFYSLSNCRQMAGRQDINLNYKFKKDIYMKRIFFGGVVAILTITSVAIFDGCKKDKVLDNKLGTQYLKSYATEQELAQFDNDPYIINYKVARYLAYGEIEDGLYECMKLNKGSYQLTDRPVIIWDYDSRPKYYEFGILVNGELVKTVTTLAKKEATNICCFMFNEVIEHSPIGDYKFFVGLYPNVFYGIPSEPGSPPSTLLDENGEATPEIPSCNILENYAKLIESMDDESRANHQTAIQDMQNEIAEFTQGLDEFWQKIAEIQPDIVQMPDVTILNGFTKSQKATTWDAYVIPAYNYYNLQHTRWAGWCGPSGIAWIYRGLYAYYPRNTSNYVRIQGDANYQEFKNVTYPYVYAYYDADGSYNPRADNGLYMRLRQECVKTGNSYPMYQAGMNSGMKAVSNNAYGIDLTLVPHDRIRVNHLPLMNMFGYDWSFHYVAAFGSGYEKKNGIIKSKWLFVTDNGTRISANGYAPYWRNQSPDPGIRYRVY